LEQCERRYRLPAGRFDEFIVQHLPERLQESGRWQRDQPKRHRIEGEHDVLLPRARLQQWRHERQLECDQRHDAVRKRNTNANADAHSHPDSITDADTNPKPITDSNSEPESHPNPDTESEPKPKPKPDADTDSITQSNSNPDPVAYSNAYSNPEPHSHADTDAKSNAYASAHSQLVSINWPKRVASCGRWDNERRDELRQQMDG
jgi:hypothetical protein